MTTPTTRNNSQNSDPAAGHFGVKNLVALLKSEGHRALNGVSAFTLTTSVLQQINSECRRHSLSDRDGATYTEIDRSGAGTEIDRSDSGTEGRNAVFANRKSQQKKGGKPSDDTEWHYQIQFVKDFMQYSNNLKLSCDSDVSTSRISLHRFSNLTSLHLQRVPVQRLQGLHLLRNSLTTLTVYKGLDKVKDLLEFCGGDARAWPQLKFVSLVFNSLSELDDSLRLIPHVQVLDVSHNLLQTCHHFLEYLVDVRQISLAYNDLTLVPSLSATTRASLTCLVLRGNNLDNLRGVRELTCLEQLDLAENCISRHNLLEPLGSLIQLKQLQLDGNPLSYHKLHRPLTASCLARQAANVKFELDKKKLKASEISYFSQVKARLVSSAAVSDLSKRGREAKGNLTSRDGVSDAIPPAAVLSKPDRDAQLEAATEPSRDRRKSRQKKGRPRESRIVEIDDTDDKHEHHIIRPGSAPFPRHLVKLMTDRRQEAMKVRREMEELRKHYGHNWLQAIEDRGVFNKKPEPEATPTPQSQTDMKSGCKLGLESQACTSSLVSQETLVQVAAHAQTEVKEEPATSDGFVDTNKPFMAAIARLAAGLSEGGADGAETCVSTGLRDPDVIIPIPGKVYTVKDDDNGKTTMSGYTKLPVLDKSDDNHFIQTQNIMNEPISEDVKDPKFQDASSKPGSKTEVEPALQAWDTPRDPNKTNTNSRLFQSLKSNSNPDNELTDNQNEASMHEVITNLAERTQLPDVVPTRRGALVQNLQTQESATVRSGDTTAPAYKNTTAPAYKNTTAPAYKSSSYVSITSSKDSQTGDSSAEEQEVIESMLVSCPLQDNEVILVTMTSRYLVEKNFRGKVTQKLELTSLNHLDWKWLDNPHSIHTAVVSDRRQLGDSVAGHVSKRKEKGKSKGATGEGDGSVQLDLRFDYLRKDKQSKCYILDAADGNILVSRLQPFLDVRDSQMKAAIKTVLQCLKCNQILPQTELDPFRNSGKTAQESTGDTDLPKDTQVCPRCGSTLIIELTSSAGTLASHTLKLGKPQRPSMSGLSGKYKTTIPLVKKVFSSFTRKSQAEKVSTQASSSTSSSSSSSSSAAGAAGRSISLPQLSRTHLSTTGDTNSGLAEDLLGRDRSSAFRAPANMSRAVAEIEDREEVGDDLVCVEDYFSSDMIGPITSCQLAEITSSLRGDSPNRISKAQVEQASYSVPTHSENMMRYMSDDESRSPNYADGTRFESAVILQKHEHSSRPITIEGVTNNRGLLRKLGQHGDNARHENDDRSVADDTEIFIRSPDGQEDERRLSAGSYNRSYGRRVFVPTLATSLGGQRSAIDSSVGRSQDQGLMKQSENSASSTASATGRSDLTRIVQHPVIVCSSVPKSVSYLHGTHVRTGQFAFTSGRVSQVLHSPVHSSLSGDPGELSETPSGHRIHDPYRDSSKPVSGPHNSEGALALATSTTEDRLGGELQDDIVSIYDFSDDQRHSPRADNVKPTPAVSSMTSEDKSCQFEEDGDCPDSLTSDLPGGHTPTNQCLPVEDKLDNGQGSNTTEAAATTISAADEATVNDEGNDDLLPNYAFHVLNHRLALFVMMSLFGTDEVFLCKLQCPIVQYIITQQYDGMLVMSSQRFYVLKFTSKDRRQPPDQWIQCVDIQPIPELRYIDVGLGGQSLRLEFVTDCSSFTLLTGSRDKTMQFVEVLHRHLTSYAIRHGMNSTVVVNEDVDESTVNNLDRDVLSNVTSGQKLLYYCIGILEKGGGDGSPISVVVTSSDICLVRANHQWPQPRLQGPVTVETVGQQFTVLERQKINNLASLTVCPIAMKKVSLELFSGGDGQSSCWNLTMASRQSTRDLVHAISTPWAQEFGVAMEVTHARLDF